MSVSLHLKTAQTQNLAPQMVQYQKLLQMNSLQLLSHIKHELEMNPMLEESDDSLGAELEDRDITEPEFDREEHESDSNLLETDEWTRNSEDGSDPNENSWQDFIEDDSRKHGSSSYEDDDYEIPIRDEPTFVDDLLTQFALLDVTQEFKIAAETILFNVESSGYLQAEPDALREDINLRIDNENLEILSQHPGDPIPPGMMPSFLSEADYVKWVARMRGVKLLNHLNDSEVEEVRHTIQTLDPPGIGSRTLQECLIIQLQAREKLDAAGKLALLLLQEEWSAFSMKHYDEVMHRLEVSPEYLQEAIDEIRRLNPKPGGGFGDSGAKAVTPEFEVVYDEKEDDFIVSVTNSSLPEIRINKSYEAMRKQARKKKFNQETKQWLKARLDDAKFLMQALNQRRETMRKVITAIVHRQKAFFIEGESGLKPLIYMDVAEDTGLDISTISRVVSGKYIQTEFGLFEMRYFFSESMTNSSGEEVSTRIIKNKLKEIIDKESKKKPLSDQKLTIAMKDAGFEIARRTVAKYREQMNIPVARLRKEIS